MTGDITSHDHSLTLSKRCDPMHAGYVITTYRMSPRRQKKMVSVATLSHSSHQFASFNL